jgi:hypothetical protein
MLSLQTEPVAPNTGWRLTQGFSRRLEAHKSGEGWLNINLRKEDLFSTA